MVTSRFVRRDDAGAVAVITAICSVLLFGVAALTVDIGRLWEVRRSSQSAVDLAALAGALHLPKTPVVACQTALQYLKDNTPPGQDPGDVDAPAMCTATGTADGQVQITNHNSRITVRTHPKIVNFGLAGAIGFKNGATAAQATAEIRSPGGIDPFAVSITNTYGGQCIHDNTNGQSRAMTAALLLPQAPATPSVTEIDAQGSAPPTKVTTIGIGEQPPLTIRGTNLNGVKSVTFGTAGTVNVPNSATTATTVDVTPPVVNAPLGPVDVIVNTANNSSSANPPNDQLTWAYIQPVVSSIAPPSGVAGTPVTVTGQHFGGNIQVFFGATQVPVQSVAADLRSLTVLAPSGAAGTTVDVTVRNPQGTSNITPVDRFTYLVTPPPTVTALAPNAGPTGGGTSVTVTGTGFVNGSTTVKFGANSGTNVVVSTPTSLTVTSPAGAAGQVDVTVTTAFGTSAATAADRFTYGAAPTVTSLSPNSGSANGGDVVTITGTGFSNPVLVFFGSALATNVTVNSATRITATSPAGTGSVDVTVTTGFGSSATNPNDVFTYFIDGCAGTTGNFGYLSIPRNDANGENTDLKLNIILGIDHIPSIYPAPAGASAPNNAVVTALPINYECDSRRDANAILDNRSPYTDGMNCLDVANGNKASDAGAALLDGFSGNPPKLACPGSGHTCGRVAGRDGIDKDSFFNYLEPGVTVATINADLSAALVAARNGQWSDPLLSNDLDLINPDIVNCPRFTILPVLHIKEDPQNGYHAVQNFVGAYIQDFTTQGGGGTPQVRTITAITFPLNWLPGAGAESDGTIPFIGTGPVVPVLIK